MMLSPQSPSVTNSSEGGRLEAQTPMNHKQIFKLLGVFSFLGILHSKLNFLFTCLSLSLVAKGFGLKWSEQTGFNSQEVKNSVSSLLNETSLELQRTVMKASIRKFVSTCEHLFSVKESSPQHCWSRGMKNYQFMLNKYSTKHQAKLNGLSDEATLMPFIPFLNLSSNPSLCLQDLIDRIPGGNTSQNHPVEEIEEFLNFQQSEFVKPPWYEKSTREPPPLPPLLEQAFEKIYSTVMNPSFWYTYQPNLSVAQRQAMAIARTLPSKDVGIYSQDKSSRICFASLSKTNEKVEMVLADSSKYKKLSKDMATTYQPKIKSWYAKYKKTLSSIPDVYLKPIVNSGL